MDTHSECVFIRFSLNYVEDYIGKYVADVFRSLCRQAEVLLEGRDEDIAAHLFGFMMREEECRREGSDHLLRQWIDSILVIAARNIAGDLQLVDFRADETGGSAYMLRYIQRHINQPELLDAANLGKTFNLSPRYVGNCFKRNFQETLRGYISRSRIRMVEGLLLGSRMTVKEIAYKMGYSDSGHLVRSFRKAYGMPPLKYRRCHLPVTNLVAEDGE